MTRARLLRSRRVEIGALIPPWFWHRLAEVSMALDGGDPEPASEFYVGHRHTVRRVALRVRYRPAPDALTLVVAFDDDQQVVAHCRAADAAARAALDRITKHA